MPQIVNQFCAICYGRISSVVAGRFCETCGNALHNDCARDRLEPPSVDHCPTCGADPSIAARVKSDEDDRRHTEAAERLHEAVRQAKQTYTGFRSVGWLIGGAAIVVLGLNVTFSPAFRTNPQNATAAELVPGIAAIVAGVGLCVLALLTFRAR